jgi:enoyl-CoA hydratase
MVEYDNIIFTKDSAIGIARIIVNRPEVNNALNRATRLELKDAVSKLHSDKEVKVVIISGAGEAFIAGADVTEMQGATPAYVEELAGTLALRLYLDIENLPMPVIAMIHGFCLGGGNEIAMSCDIRIASDEAKFGQPEINLGFIPGSGGTQRLPRLIGPGRAKEMIFTGSIIGAAEAERIGLVDKVVPAAELEQTVDKLTRSIANKSSTIVRMAKQAVNFGLYTDLAAGIRHETKIFSLCFTTEDQKEGVNAFLEKRRPDFKGK